jgi:hypothetical protein
VAIIIEAIYENGVLKPAQPLSLREREQVRVSIQRTADAEMGPMPLQRGGGLMPWTGSVEDLDHLIEDDENDPLEGP